jgi:cell division protease FtsH
MNSKRRIHLIYFVIAVMGVMFLQNVWVQYQTVEPIPYSEFQTLLQQEKVKDIVISADDIKGELTEPNEQGKRRFVTTRVDPELAATLDKHGVKYSQAKESTFAAALLSWVLPMLLIVGFWFFIIRRLAERGAGMGPGLMSIGKSRAKVYVETDTKVSFKDVAGVDEAKQELEEIVAFLRAPDSYGRLGARMPKGILLVGPPGTGKTLLARAVAGEAGVPFFSISGSEFVEMFVGVGAARVRDLFEQARSKAPCIIFIDELDALGRARNTQFGGHDEKEQTLNQLLVELDGFDPSSGLVLLAATNRPEILDPALLRAGRFDRQVLVDRPDRIGRCQILEVHMKKIAVADDVDTAAIAALTPGFTGADLANLVNEAALVATRRRAEAVSAADFSNAIERIIAGLEKKNRLLNPQERRFVAYHEMGHALVASALPATDPVHKVSIIPRGIGALGYTIQRPTDDRYLMTRDELEQKMTVLLGGRAAEHIVFHHTSTGAADDLRKVTDIARSMVARYAMVEDLGPVVFDVEPSSFLTPTLPRPREYSDTTASQIDAAVKQLVQASFDRACAILERNRPVLEDGAERLLAQETLDEAALRELFARVTTEAAGRVQAAGLS